MFLPTMTDEELERAAYKDFLEIRTNVLLSLNRFIHNLKLARGQRRAVHSLREEHVVRTRAKNEWTVSFRYLNYQADDSFRCAFLIYTTLRRENGTDYLFICDLDRFKFERICPHFVQRYRERYLDIKEIDLKGDHPAIYYMLSNNDRHLAFYLPKDWTEDQLMERAFLVSEQGMSLIYPKGNSITYITFLDQENLSRYKAQIYEEETFLRMLRDTINADELGRQALFKRFRVEPRWEKALERFVWRLRQTKVGTEQEEVIEKFLDLMRRIKIDSADFERRFAEEVKKYEAKSFLEFGIENPVSRLVPLGRQ